MQTSLTKLKQCPKKKRMFDDFQNAQIMCLNIETKLITMAL